MVKIGKIYEVEYRSSNFGDFLVIERIDKYDKEKNN